MSLWMSGKCLSIDFLAKSQTMISPSDWDHPAARQGFPSGAKANALTRCTMGVSPNHPDHMVKGPFPIQINHRKLRLDRQSQTFARPVRRSVRACRQPDGTRSIFLVCARPKLTNRTGQGNDGFAIYGELDGRKEAAWHPRQPFPSPACSPPPFQIFIRSGSELLILLDLGIRLTKSSLARSRSRTNCRRGFSKTWYSFSALAKASSFFFRSALAVVRLFLRSATSFCVSAALSWLGPTNPRPLFPFSTDRLPSRQGRIWPWLGQTPFATRPPPCEASPACLSKPTVVLKGFSLATSPAFFDWPA